MMVGVNISDEQLGSIADRTIQEADQDGDSAISFTEFVKVLEKVDVEQKMSIRTSFAILLQVYEVQMLMEGLLLWSKVVAVSMRLGPRMRLYYAAGWGIPVAIVAITLVMHPYDYVASGHCWLNVHTDAIWAFVGPVLFVLTVSSEV
ncbi:hypothetical protein A6R68_01388 [Neotoma lepida]|uniref:G-protein coupled receptors family 2 profile 2 domain-containing protein n=1 Tax=Neotoma lepida TaxID=56216 RepID=A0A1A6GV68_NEOLE|nr:hypothetical protein A6R68_01388 [Neotoma lepida]